MIYMCDVVTRMIIREISSKAKTFLFTAENALFYLMQALVWIKRKRKRSKVVTYTHNVKSFWRIVLSLLQRTIKLVMFSLRRQADYQHLTHRGQDKMAAIYLSTFLECTYLKENIWISIKISLNFVRKGPINNIPALAQIMAWRRPGAYPCLNHLWLICWRIYVSLGRNDLMIRKGRGVFLGY